MKSLLSLLFSCFALSLIAQDPSTALRVYEIFQNKCVSCHNHASPRAGLDLEGSGSSTLAKAFDVYDNLVGVSPKNASAAGKGYQYVMPGRIDKSFFI